VISALGGRTVREALLDAASALLRAGIDDAKLEARLLLQDVTGHSWAHLLAYPDEPMTPSDAQKLDALIRRRCGREPFAHVVGYTEFRGLRLRVDNRVLVPRPETELLAGVAIDRCERGGVVVDVGTGSGAIALAVARERPDVTVLASDISGDALSVAAGNARALGLDDRVLFVRCDLLSAMAPGRYNLVANLPYVAEGELVTPQPELDWEPRLALAGGPDGLDVYRRFLRQAATVVSEGIIAFEIGEGQASAARAAASQAFPLATVSVEPDLGGIERIVVVES
jgi:release factor glutamine methyltransferase